MGIKSAHDELEEVILIMEGGGHKVCTVTGRKPELSPQDGVDKFW